MGISVGYARGAIEKSSFSGKVKPKSLNIAIVNMSPQTDEQRWFKNEKEEKIGKKINQVLL